MGSSASYTRRVIDGELDELLPHLSAIALDGAKGVGKTATADGRAATTYRLDDPATRELLAADPTRLAAAREPILVDEHQRWEPAWDLVRRAVDDDPRPGRFLLTGSATLPHPSSHSGAGRIVRLPMRPMTLPERGLTTPTVSLAGLLSGSARIEGSTGLALADYTRAIVRGGFPGMQTLPDRPARAALAGYADLIVDRDVPEAGFGVRNPAQMRAWLRAIAAATATTATWETLRDAASPGRSDPPPRSTTGPWTDALTRTRVYDPLPAWQPGFGHLKRLAASPKHHLADPALACTLLALTADDLLSGGGPTPVVPRDGTFLGSLFESLATLSVRVFAQAAEAQVGHLRRRDGDHEIDLIVHGTGRRRVAIEVKLSRLVTDTDVKHLLWLKGLLGDELADMVVLTTGGDAYRRRDGVAVVPLALLGP